ncbi:hypothetical protein [Nonomuraea sp. NPDC049684]|uniref:hypothetical protein n=1 Tax=Nonomuraea sp. NPDC049684 TaxID=3364356 RepID=UPI00379479EF
MAEPDLDARDPQQPRLLGDVQVRDVGAEGPRRPQDGPEVTAPLGGGDQHGQPGLVRQGVDPGAETGDDAAGDGHSAGETPYRP